VHARPGRYCADGRDLPGLQIREFKGESELIKATTPDGKTFTGADTFDILQQLEEAGFQDVVFMEKPHTATVVVLEDIGSQIEK
jgi:hypothetical protein